jgi:hypothetical protein
MKRPERLVESPADDRGAALLMVLLIVLVISLVGAALLTFADTSIRTTVALRSQGASVYAADGAAQIAVNQLRADNFNGVASGCGSTTTEVLSNFYAAANGTPVTSAAVRCTPDANNQGIGVGSNSSPGSAMLSLGTGQGGEDGIWDGSVNNLTFKVSGGIFSNSNINLGGKSGGVGSGGNAKSVIANISTNSYVFAMGAISGPGALTVVGTTTTTANYSSNPQSALDRRGWDPQLVPGHGTSFDPPSAPTGTAIVPPCTGKKVYDLYPGLYTSAASLNALTGSGNSGACAKSVVHFNPGTYYFNFQDAAVAHKWTSNAAWVVAGTAIGTLSVASPPAMTPSTPSCVGPGTAGATTSSGVEFVFGGDSRMDFTSSGSSDGNIEICASNATSGPPVAIYGLKTAIGAGAMAVPALSGCITATPYIAGGDSGHCALIQSYQDPTPKLTVHGTVYVPTAPIDIVFNNSSAQYFQWGLVARTILIGSTGSAGALANATISVPNTAPAPFALPNIMYLDVFVCPGSSSCSTSGTVQLRAKVLLSATPPTTATVLSWSAQR